MAASALLVAAACTSSEADVADADDDAATTTEAVDLALPTRPLQGAAVVPMDDEVWIIGGAVGYDPYEANPLIIRRSVEGEVLGTLPLDIDDTEILEATSRPTVVDGTTYLLGVRCTFNPDGENGACVRGDPVLHRVGPDGLAALAVPDGWGTGGPNTPGSFGYPPRVVGTAGDRIVTAEVLGDGPIPASTEEVAVALYDPTAETVTAVPTVPGVVTGTSVCADGERIYSLAPAITDDRQVTGADLWAQDDPVGSPDAPPRKVATIALDDPQRLVSGGLTCADGFVMVTGSGGGGLFVRVDTDTGEVGDVTGGDEWGRSLGAPAGGDGTRLVLTQSPQADTDPVRHRLVTGTGVADLPDGGVFATAPGIGPSSAVVEVDGRLYEVGAWLHQPDVEQPPIALT